MTTPTPDRFIDIGAQWVAAHERCNVSMLTRQLRYLARDLAYLLGAAIFAGLAFEGAITVALHALAR